MTDVYLTPAANAVVSPHGWAQLPSGRWVTRLPLLDDRTTDFPGPALFAHLDYEQLLLVCTRLGARPISPEGVVELNAHGLRLEPVTFYPDSSGRATCEAHDQAVWQQLVRLDWDGVIPVANAGKPWVSGAQPGRSRLFGWSKSKASRSMAFDAFGEWLQPLQNAHNRQHTDYSSLCTLERDTPPEDEPHDTEPPPETRRKSDAPAGQAGAFPHGYRCSVAELVQDAKAIGTWRPIADVRAGRYRVREGDLLIHARAGQEPEHGGSGHVQLAEFDEASEDADGIAVPPEVMVLGGNESDTWHRDIVELSDSTLRGVIERGELGRKAIVVARAELDAHVHETAGVGATARIQEYHAGARRGGSRVAGMPGHENEGSDVLGAKASDEVPWCSSAASFCAYVAAKG